MDHSEAVRLQAAEKYVLGELPADVRDEYEAHFFDCQDCAADVRTAVAFVSASRKALRDLPQDSGDERVSYFDAWLNRFFRPAWTVPALALLLIALIYQTFVAIPSRYGTPRRYEVATANFVSLIGANSRAEGAKVFSLKPNQPVILELDIPPSSDQVSGYWLDIVDFSDHVAFSTNVSAADARNTVHLIVPAGKLTAGQYKLSAIAQKAEPAGAEARRSPVFETKFTIEVIH